MLSAQHLKIAAVVTAYFVVSISMVFANKTLMSPGSSIQAPLFVTWFQCVVTSLILWVCGTLGRSSDIAFFKQFPAPVIQWDIAKKILPLSSIFVGMVAFNNLCLLYVEVSFYNVARSLTIVANVVLSFLLLGTRTSLRVGLCLGVVIIGFFVGADGEVNFSLIGTLFGVASSVFVSLNSIYTKQSIGFVNDDKWLLQFYANFNAGFLFLPLIFITGEHWLVFESPLLFDLSYWFAMVVGGILGFLIGIVTIMQIQITSPLTHNISGTAKACVQTVLALLIYKNPTSTGANVGLVLVLAGSLAYAVVKMEEEKRDKSLAKPSTSNYQLVKQHPDLPHDDQAMEALEMGMAQRSVVDRSSRDDRDAFHHTSPTRRND